ncbi:MAG: SRPBCC domain-containing protein [Sandaracinaceae bacterium]|nr:SRPBCC domain-containing protein [Sandaracinaceae bacterium]
MHLEPKLGGRLFETFHVPSGAERVQETGRITTWEPPSRVVLAWRLSNFAPDETTEVEVTFEPTRSGTNVTVTHRGWATIRPDHPARHGQEMRAFTRSLGAWWGDLVTSYRMLAEA